MRAYLDTFISHVRVVLGQSAAGKGYQDDPGDRPGGDLLAFTKKHFDGHALGEVVYKAVRYRSKGDPMDLVKIAAWAFLEWTNNMKALAPVVAATPNGGMDEVLRLVSDEAVRAFAVHPGVVAADPVRLAGLVVEEAGEAMKAALDLTRGTPTADDAKHLLEELVQTAAMASIALVVLKSRGGSNEQH